MCLRSPYQVNQALCHDSHRKTGSVSRHLEGRAFESISLLPLIVDEV